MDDSTQAHECFVSISVDARRAGSEIRQAGGGAQGAAAVVLREIDKIADGLRSAGVRVEGWCPPRLLGEVIRTAYDPLSRPLVQRRGGGVSDFRGGDTGLPSGVDPLICGPMRAENWSYYRTGLGRAHRRGRSCPRRDSDVGDEGDDVTGAAHGETPAALRERSWIRVAPASRHSLARVGYRCTASGEVTSCALAIVAWDALRAKIRTSPVSRWTVSDDPRVRPRKGTRALTIFGSYVEAAPAGLFGGEAGTAMFAGLPSSSNSTSVVTR